MQPLSATSVSGEWRLDSAPTAPDGLAGSVSRLSHGGGTEWLRFLPLAFRDARVFEDGFTVGHGYAVIGNVPFLCVWGIDPAGRVREVARLELELITGPEYADESEILALALCDEDASVTLLYKDLTSRDGNYALLARYPRVTAETVNLSAVGAPLGESYFAENTVTSAQGVLGTPLIAVHLLGEKQPLSRTWLLDADLSITWKLEQPIQGSPPAGCELLRAEWLPQFTSHNEILVRSPDTADIVQVFRVHDDGSRGWKVSTEPIELRNVASHRTVPVSSRALAEQPPIDLGAILRPRVKSDRLRISSAKVLGEGFVGVVIESLDKLFLLDASNSSIVVEHSIPADEDRLGDVEFIARGIENSLYIKLGIRHPSCAVIGSSGEILFQEQTYASILAADPLHDQILGAFRGSQLDRVIGHIDTRGMGQHVVVRRAGDGKWFRHVKAAAFGADGTIAVLDTDVQYCPDDALLTTYDAEFHPLHALRIPGDSKPFGLAVSRSHIVVSTLRSGLLVASLELDQIQQAVGEDGAPVLLPNPYQSEPGFGLQAGEVWLPDIDDALILRYTIPE